MVSLYLCGPPPPIPRFYGLAEAMWGWGCVCICMCKRGFAILSCVNKKNGKARVQFYCFDLSWCPSLQIVPWADHVLWMLVATSPNHGYRTAIPVTSWMSVRFAWACAWLCSFCPILCICCQHSDQTTCKFTENRNTNWITWRKNTKKKAHTREHIKSQLQTTAYTQKDLYCSMYHQFIEQTTTYMKHKSLVGAFIVHCSSYRSSSKLARKKLLRLH